MAYSYIEYTADGATTTFAIPFSYTNESDLTVYVGGVDTSFSFLSSSTVSVSPAPAQDAVVRIARKTPIDSREVDFSNGAILTESDLDRSNIQVFQAAQEAIDTAGEALFKTADGKFDAQSRTVKNVKDPVDAQDAVTKKWAETSMSSELAQATLQADAADVSADAAYQSEVNAGTHSSNALAYKNAAGVSADTATTQAGIATTKASTATTQAGIATTQAGVATTKAGEASTSAGNAATSESNASTSAGTATTQAGVATTQAGIATTKAGEASTSAGTASTQAGIATTKAGEASTSAGTATTKAGEASTSATNADKDASDARKLAIHPANTQYTLEDGTTGFSAQHHAWVATTASGNATTSASNAATSESNAAGSASAAAVSESNAANSAASAATALDNFDDRYLGTKTSAPTLDNDGNPLVTGALYFHTGEGMKVWDGANWIDASAASNVSLYTYEYTATAGQTTFSGSDDNGQTMSYTASNIIVTYGGMDLDSDDYTATNGTSVVLADGALAGKIVRVIAFTTFQVADTYTQAQADAAFKPIAARSAKNILINGGLDVWQRGTSTTAYSSAGKGYIADRFAVRYQSLTERSTDVPSGEGFKYSIKCTTVSAADPWCIQYIENADKLRGQTVTFSYWIKSPDGGSLRANYFGGPHDTPTLNGTNWTHVKDTFTVPATVNDGEAIFIQLAANTVATYYITGIQLELGSTATDFEHRSYGEELALCQRYFLKSAMYAQSYQAANNDYSVMVHFPVEMRAVPTMTILNTPISTNVTSGPTFSGMPTNSADAVRVQRIQARRTTTGYIEWGSTFTADAEL